MAYVALVASAVGAVVGAYGSYESAQSQKSAMQYQAAVAKNDQTIANQYAQAEIQKGQVLEQEKRQETAQRESMVRAAAGGAGLDPNASGSSPLRLQSDTAMLGEQDALTIRNNAQRAAYGYQVQGLNYASQAQLDEMGASSAARAGTLGIWSSIIGGASSVSDKWWRYKQAGIGSSSENLPTGLDYAGGPAYG
jgi:hypothetical protein